MKEQYILELAETYVNGGLPDTEVAALNNRLQTDPVFAAEFQECVDLIRSLEGSGAQKRFRNMLIDIRQDAAAKHQIKMIPLKTHYIRTGAIAAGIALLTTLSTFSIVNHSEKKRSSQYSLLKRELETIKRSQNVQNALIQNINNKQSQPVAQANYSGTGFALTNDGYFLTNYHVTQGADSIYIQNKDGNYYRAHLVTFDENSDVAILKVDNKGFHFSKTEVPYTLASNKKSLGARVFTLGYPQDDIVYNEGYISSRNGFQGDSLQYMLELPANPGQSGAPVIDANGNIIAIVTGKESETEGRTYAVSTQAVYQLLSSMNKEIKIPKVNRLGRLNREDQIEKLQTFTCAVKVYKK